MAESFSREKLRQAPQKRGREILCDPGWYVHNPDVQNKWDDNTHTHTHTHTHTYIRRIKRVQILAQTVRFLFTRDAFCFLHTNILRSRYSFVEQYLTLRSVVYLTL